jgi:hypothetical protein
MPVPNWILAILLPLSREPLLMGEDELNSPDRSVGVAGNPPEATQKE